VSRTSGTSSSVQWRLQNKFDTNIRPRVAYSPVDERALRERMRQVLRRRVVRSVL
jgi:hypothetical protein